MHDRKAAFYCSASYTIDPKYNQVAREAVRAACLRGYDIVSGGTVKGTMGVIAEEASKYPVANIGVIPHFMKGLEYPGLTECIWTDLMSERKDAMREGTCIAVALPGGIGTMDELIETLVLAKLKRYSGKVVALNFEGFYDPFKALLDHYVATNMLEPCDRELISFPTTVEEFESLL